MARAVHRASRRSCGARGRRSTPHFPCAWQAQYTELSGGAAARWPPLARGCLLPGRCSTQSVRTSASALPFCVAGAVYTELPGGAAAQWPPLARSCLLPGRRSTQSLRTSLLRGMRSTQSFLEELWRGGRHWPAAAFCLAGAVHRASALPFCVAGAVHRAFWRSCGAVAAAGPRLPFAWQTQYTEPPHFPFTWHAQYTELSGGAAARWPPLVSCLLHGRCSTQSVRTSASALSFCVAGAVHRASWRSCGAVAAAGPRLPYAWEHTDDSVSLRCFQSHRLISSFTSSPVPGTLHCTE